MTFWSGVGVGIVIGLTIAVIISLYVMDYVPPTKPLRYKVGDK
jgi:hypothetical protein